jgi:SAM-dependent methyltransferase
VDEVPGQDAYVGDHLARFHELAHAARVLVGGLDRARVLELGPSAFSALYRRILPGCHLVLADRPAEGSHRGFDAALCDRIARPDGFVAVDLAGPLDAAAAALDAHGPFDLVVFTEVLEHLARHPAEVLGFLLGRLSPGGFLYLTTPNALSRGSLHMIGRKRNPQQMFPRQGANWDAHHHVREYTMSELVEAIREAGGRVRALHFSSCWDEPEHAEHLAAHPDQRGNLVVIASRASG